MHPRKLIDNTLRRAAAHVRLLTLLEGLLLLATVVGSFLLVEIFLDHALSLTPPVRLVCLGLLLAVFVVIFLSSIFVPLLRTVNRLYLAKRVEMAFPHFKNSLITYVQFTRRAKTAPVTSLIGARAAGSFDGVDVDGGLDSRRFVRLGYAFVILVIATFAYSVVSSKSMFTSFVRVVKPWADIPPPTVTRISNVSPGNIRVLQGTDVTVSAEVTPARPPAVLVRWSRDGELWHSLQASRTGDTYTAKLEHVETGIVYYVCAADANSPKYKISTLVPPVVSAVSARLEYPSYTRLEPREVDEGNIEAPEGTRVLIRIESNKLLQSASLALPAGIEAPLSVEGRFASGSFTVEGSGRYSVLLTDPQGLQSQTPVQYDLVSIPDLPPEVSLEGPAPEAPVALSREIPFAFEARDDYGVSRMTLHFQTYQGNANAKEYLLPGDRSRVLRTPGLVPELLGARPGDTVTYYLQTTDNNSGNPKSARTPTYSFKVAGPETPGMAVDGIASSESPEPSKDLPGAMRRETGQPEKDLTSPSREFAASDLGAESARSRDELLNMLGRDEAAWDKIEKHLARADTPDPAEVPPTVSESPVQPSATAEGGSQNPSAPDALPRAADSASEASSSQSSSATTGNGDSNQSSGSAPSDPAQSTEAGSSPGEGSDGAPSPAGAAGETSAPPASSQPASTQSTGDSPAGSSSQESSPGEPGAPVSSSADGGQTSSPGDADSSASAEGGSSSDSAAPPPGQPSDSTPSDAAGSSGASGQPSSPSDVSDAQPSQTDSMSQESSGASSASSASPGEGTTPSPGGSTQPAAGDPAQNPASTPEPPATSDSDEDSSSSSSSSSSGQTAGGDAPSGGSDAGDRVGPASSEPTEGPDTPDAPPAAPASAEERIRTARRLLDTLTRDIAARRFNKELLEDLGWQPPTLRTFVRKYETAMSDLERAPFTGQIPLESSLDHGAVMAGSRLPGSVGSADTAGVETAPEIAEAIKALSDQQVSPEYRKVLEAYYRALAAASGEKAE